jgi:tetratricopeptide (TPR) repeat protein
VTALAAFTAAQRGLDRGLAMEALMAADRDRATAAQAALDRAPGDAQVALEAVHGLPPDQRAALARTLAERLPGSALAAGTAADALLAIGDRDGAIALAREAVRRAPTHLRNRDRLIRILERSGRTAEAAAERAERDRLEPLVHGADRRP